jgi:hypothetical protein
MLRHHICSSYCLCIKEQKIRRADGTVGTDVKCRFFDIFKSNMHRVEGKHGYYVTAEQRPAISKERLRRNHKGVLAYEQRRILMLQLLKILLQLQIMYAATTARITLRVVLVFKPTKITRRFCQSSSQDVP